MRVEIGCGAAQTTETLATVGLDSDIGALMTWRNRSLICADAMALPLRTASCEGLILQAVLHHLLPTDRALGELARVLKPGGQLDIVDGLALAPHESARLDAELKANGFDPEPIYGFDIDQLTGQVENAGFKVTKIEIEGRSTFATPPHVSKVYATDRFELAAVKLA